MAEKKQAEAAQNREDRLKAALKANMAKRKAQARARQVDPFKDRADQDTGEDRSNG